MMSFTSSNKDPFTFDVSRVCRAHQAYPLTASACLYIASCCEFQLFVSLPRFCTLRFHTTFTDGGLHEATKGTQPSFVVCTFAKITLSLMCSPPTKQSSIPIHFLGPSFVPTMCNSMCCTIISKNHYYIDLYFCLTM